MSSEVILLNIPSSCFKCRSANHSFSSSAVQALSPRGVRATIFFVLFVRSVLAFLGLRHPPFLFFGLRRRKSAKNVNCNLFNPKFSPIVAPQLNKNEKFENRPDFVVTMWRTAARGSNPFAAASPTNQIRDVSIA